MSNMYPQSIKQWNPFVGCHYSCTYCQRSFQAQLKRWAKANCSKCYNYLPHEHPERLSQKFPHTKKGQFVFCCACSDVTFCKPEFLEQIIEVITKNKQTDFLIQSKNPQAFIDHLWPKNVILGTTIETNRDTLEMEVSFAPHPYERFKDLLRLDHHRKAVTIEPVIDFDLSELLPWLVEINPVWVQIGYDTRKTGLEEPPLWKVDELILQLQAVRTPVFTKLIREPI